jgi:hypothetical protein
MILVTNNLLSIIPTVRSRSEKTRVHSRGPNAANFRTSLEYIKASFPRIPQTVSEQVIDFLESKCSKIDAFDKKTPEANIKAFLNIAIAYHAYDCRINNGFPAAKKVLALQDLLRLSKNTYPDEQSIINAGKIISEGARLC